MNDLFFYINKIVNYFQNGGISMFFLFILAMTLSYNFIILFKNLYLSSDLTIENIHFAISLNENCNVKTSKIKINNEMESLQCNKLEFLLSIIKEFNESAKNNFFRSEIVNNYTDNIHKDICFLKSLVYIAPLIGLFGTVIGMIKTFNSLSTANAMNDNLSRGISEALITTEQGLIIAIGGMIALTFSNKKLKLLKIKLMSLVHHLNLSMQKIY